MEILGGLVEEEKAIEAIPEGERESETAPESPKTRQKVPKRAPRGSNIDPKGHPNGSKTAHATEEGYGAEKKNIPK